MPIVNFSFDRSTVPADAVNVAEHSTPSSEGDRKYWTWLSHIGLCLFEREYNGYDDSDFYMTVWNPEKGEPYEIMFASTRGWTYPALGSRADATPEVLAAYEVWAAKKRAERQAAYEAAEAKKPYKGRYVRVVRGRKIPQGLTGYVFYYGEDRFARSRYSMGIKKFRVGIQFPDGTREFTAASNVEVIPAP